MKKNIWAKRLHPSAPKRAMPKYRDHFSNRGCPFFTAIWIYLLLWAFRVTLLRQLLQPRTAHVETCKRLTNIWVGAGGKSES